MSDFHLLDQSLSALYKCYSNTSIPQRIEKAVDQDLAFDGQLYQFANAARRGVYLPGVRKHLLEQASIAARDLKSGYARIEYFWFLYSQKAWAEICRFCGSIDPGELGELPAHIADLRFLAFYRMQRERLMAGTDREGFLRDAADCIALLEKAWPTMKEHHQAYAGMVAHITGDIDEARETLSSLVSAVPFIEPFLAIENVLPNVPMQKVPPGNLDIRPASAKHATLISLDRVYFDKFAYLVAKRYLETNPNNALHFHCVGFDPGAAIADWNLPLRIGYTIDSNDISVLGHRQRRGYFAAARYLYLAQYLDTYSSVFVADVDGLVVRDIETIAAEHENDDVVLSTKVLDPDRQINRLSWESVTACSFLARSTTGGKRFADAMGARAISENKAFWYADQNALFYSWYDLRDEIRFAPFGEFAFVQRGSWKLFQGDGERLKFLSGQPQSRRTT